MYCYCHCTNRTMASSAGADIDPGSHRADLEARLERLREECPTNYGYLVRQWTGVREGIEATPQNYPSAKQVHRAIDEPEGTPQTVGPALKALESLGVIGLWSESVGANRYDLTEYEAGRSARLDELIDEHVSES